MKRAADTKDVKFKLELFFLLPICTICFAAISEHGRQVLYKSRKKTVESGKCKIQWMEFLYFYEHHVFAYDIFEIQFGTCPIISSLNANFFCVFLRVVFSFEIPMTFFFLSSQACFHFIISGSEQKNYNENIKQLLSGIQRAFIMII